MDKDESTPPIDPFLVLPSATIKPKRTKTTHACDHCKRKKVKCNGEHPCTRCQKLAVHCTFTPHQSKWDSSAPYAITQAQRLYALEKALDSLQVDFPAPSQDIIHYSTSGDNCTAFATMTSPLEKFNTSSIGQPYYADDWETRLDRLPATIHKITTLSEKEAKIPNDSAQSETATIHFDLISIYFDHVHPYIPIIHQESFCYDINSASPLLVNAMYAISSQWSENMDDLLSSSGNPATTQEQRSSSQKGNHTSCSLKYYRDAIALIELYLDAPRLSTIQALLLIIKYQEPVRRNGFFSRTRFYLGLVARMCNDLGLPYALPPTCQAQPILVEERRRVFWVAYIYDLLISTELGTPAHFSADQCIVQLPGLLDDEQNCKKQYDTILYLHWMAKVMKAQGMVLHYLRQKYEDRSHQQRQHSTRHLHLVVQHMKELGTELTTWKEHGDARFDFVFLGCHFTNILLYRSMSLDLQDKNAGDGTINKFGLGPMAGQDAIKTLLRQEANAITNIVDALLNTGIGSLRLHHGFRGGQQLIHYLTAVRTVQLMYRQEDDTYVKKMIYHLTKLTPAVELPSMDQQQQTELDTEMGLTENMNRLSTKHMRENSTNQQKPLPPLPPPSSSSSSSGHSPLPPTNTVYHKNTSEYGAQSSSIYTDDNFTSSLDNILHNTTSLTFSSSGFYQHHHQLNQNWAQPPQQNGSSLASTSKHNASLTLDTSALPLLYQPSSSSDISPMIPTPLSLNVEDLTTSVPAPLSSAIHPSIRARRSHQQLRKALPPQWVSSTTTTTTVTPTDHFSPTYSRSITQQPSSSPAPPTQRMHAIASRQSSPSTSSLPSSPLHRMTLSDDPTPWVQSTPSLVLPSYPQQHMQQPPLSPSYVQPYGSPLPPREDQHHMMYDDTLLDNTMLSAPPITLPPPVDESVNELLAPDSLAWNHR